MSTSEKEIVVIGGGSGCITIEDGLLRKTSKVIGITGIHDNGGHSGEIRSKLGVLPPGDITHRMGIRIRDSKVRDLFFYKLNGQRAINELLAAATYKTGRMSQAVKLLEKAFKAHYLGQIIPVSDDDVHLRTELADGSFIDGETSLDLRTSNVPPVNDITFIPKLPNPNPEAIEAIHCADGVVIGSGDFWTSVMPIVKTPGIAKAIAETKAPIIWICNISTKYAETDGYTASTFAEILANEIGRKIDFALLNTADHSFPFNYLKENSFPVEPDVEDCRPFVHQIRALPLSEVVNIGGKKVVRHRGEKASQLIIAILTKPVKIV